MESPVLFSAQKSGTEITPSCLFIPSWLKKSTYNNGIKIVRSHLLSRPVSHINKSK